MSATNRSGSSCLADRSVNPSSSMIQDDPDDSRPLTRPLTSARITDTPFSAARRKSVRRAYSTTSMPPCSQTRHGARRLEIRGVAGLPLTKPVVAASSPATGPVTNAPVRQIVRVRRGREISSSGIPLWFHSPVHRFTGSLRAPTGRTRHAHLCTFTPLAVTLISTCLIPRLSNSIGSNPSR